MIQKFMRYFHNYKKYLYISCICVVLETMFELIIPMIMADIIDVGVVNKDVSYIFLKGSLMALCALLSLLLGILYARFAALAGQGFGAELRGEEFRRLSEFSFGNMDRFSTSSLVTRLTSDVTVLQNAISGGIRPAVRAPVMLVMAITMSFVINARLALVFVAAVPILAIALICIIRKLRPMYGKMQRAVDMVNRVTQENLIAIRVVKSFVRGNYEKEKFKEVNDDLQFTSEKAFHTAMLNMPCFQFVMYFTIVAILWFGGNLIYVGNMKVGELTGFLSYVLQILNSLMMLSNVFMMLTRSVASAVRIQEVMEEQSEIKDDLARDIEVGRGSIDFEHVNFKYKVEAEEFVLSDITFHIEAGQTVGIIGGTGSAKTSLVQLIPRLYDVTEGTVKIDGISVKEYPMKHLREAIGMVLQRNTLFSGTIRDNLLWGNEKADDSEINWACRIACADEFISKIPQGLDFDLGQGGVNVSGGQKQRLCIARALLKRPKILILDDSTSAVDTATEKKIRDGLERDLGDTTKIIIAQRISSVKHADQIIVLDDGRIDAVGTHETLVLTNSIYQEVYHSQQEGADK
ncbi:ABC transporter ATP-binding protein [uncultured Robinsoniella sp.]|uniref:ABC transporter ATP-binding protein n=1 Tax=uncultured Robinsoniella sp. TaxID=904190 RepID=UPI00374FA0E0